MLQYGIMLGMTAVFVLLYTPRLLAWFAPIRPQKRMKNGKKNRLALIIPARNEGKAVLPLFESVLGQSYRGRVRNEQKMDGDEPFHVFVVVKDPQDPVIGYAESIGATVYVDEKQTCKGDCLDYCLRAVLKDYPGKYDGYVIVDADCRLAPDFLEEMNNAMAGGAQIINGRKLVGNYDSQDPKDCNIITCCNGLIWTIIDQLGNRFKSDHGLTTMTITTGILFRRELVEQWQGWHYRQTLTEDMELQRDCGVQGYKTFYYSHARLYMQEAPSHRDTNKRRSRWMTGLTKSDGLYFGRLKQRQGVRAFWDNYYLLCLWLVYAYIGGLFLVFLGNVCYMAVRMITELLFHKSSLWDILSDSFMKGAAGNLGPALGAFFLIYLCFFALTLAAMLADRKNIRLGFWEKLKLLLVHPLFYMEYIQIVAKAVFREEPMQWEEIERVNIRAKN